MAAKINSLKIISKLINQKIYALLLGKLRSTAMRYLFAPVFLFFFFTSRGQINIINRSLVDSSMNYLYIGIDNNIVVKGNVEEFKMVIVGGGGSITKDGADQYYVRVNSQTDLCEIQLWESKKIVIKKLYKVRVIKNAAATFAGSRDTTVRKAIILANPFLKIIIRDCYWRHYYRVVSFSTTFVLYGDSITLYTLGERLSNEQLMNIKLLNVGENIMFDNIKVAGPDSRCSSAPPFWIKVE